MTQRFALAVGGKLHSRALVQCFQLQMQGEPMDRESALLLAEGVIPNLRQLSGVDVQNHMTARAALGGTRGQLASEASKIMIETSEATGLDLFLLPEVTFALAGVSLRFALGFFVAPESDRAPRCTVGSEASAASFRQLFEVVACKSDRDADPQLEKRYEELVEPLRARWKRAEEKQDENRARHDAEIQKLVEAKTRREAATREKRLSAGQCVLCGEGLSWIQRKLGAKEHRDCVVFRD